MRATARGARMVGWLPFARPAPSWRGGWAIPAGRRSRLARSIRGPYS